MPGVAVTLRVGDAAVVSTPAGEVVVTCVRETSGRVRIAVEAPSACVVERRPRKK